MEDLLNVSRAVLSATPARWISLAETLPADLLTRRPAPGEWSALECLQHLIDTERAVFPVRIAAFLAGRDFPAFDPDAQGSKADAGQSPLELAHEFDRLRTASLALLAKVTPADMGKQARHQELGMVTFGEMMHEWAGHDLMHLVQAERALMQPFIAGCGPWQSYFSDHVVRGK